MHFGMHVQPSWAMALSSLQYEVNRASNSIFAFHVEINNSSSASIGSLGYRGCGGPPWENYIMQQFVKHAQGNHSVSLTELHHVEALAFLSST